VLLDWSFGAGDDRRSGDWRSRVAVMPLGLGTAMTYLLLALLAFAQNVTFSLVSRSRNRSSTTYHIIAALLSNTVWFLTFRYLVTANMTWDLFLPYTVGTVAGSVSGVKISMIIERWLGARSDSHIKAPPTPTPNPTSR
jgi:hypothetical protein